MALVTIPGGGHLALGDGWWPGVSPIDTVTQVIASGDAVGLMIRCPKAGTLDKFEWMCDAYAGTSTVRHSFQTVDPATGFPDGTVDQFRTGNPTGGAWMVPGLITSDGTDGGVKRTVTKNELLACVIDFSAFTSGSLTVRGALSMSNSFTGCYLARDTGAGYAFLTSQQPVLALKYNDGTYGLFGGHVWPIKAIATRAVNTGTAPDEVGLKFTVPFPCRLSSVIVYADFDGDCDVVLYSAADAVLASVSLDKDVRSVTGAQFRPEPLSADVTLAAATTYRLVLKPTSVTSVTVYEIEVDSATLMGLLPGGADWKLTERTDAGAWTDTATKRVPFGLRFDQVDDAVPVATGGGPIFGGMILR